MPSRSFKSASVLLGVLAVSGSAVAGIGDSLPVEFTLEFSNDTLGDVVLNQVFDADIDIAGVTFGGDGMFDVTTPGYEFPFSDLAVILAGDTISGTGQAILESFAWDVEFDFSFDGFGTAWDGTSAEGIGIVEFTPEGGFTVDTHQMVWSIAVVPGPGALGLLAVAGIASRRRRD